MKWTVLFHFTTKPQRDTINPQYGNFSYVLVREKDILTFRGDPMQPEVQWNVLPRMAASSLLHTNVWL